LKAKLERALHTRITVAEWEALRDAEMLSMYEADGYVSWEEFKGDVANTLGRLRRYLQNTQREQAGKLPLETEIRDRIPKPDVVADISAPLSERTAARVGALNALDQLRLGPTGWGGIITREMRSGIRPHGGYDGTLPQWVIELTIEAWVPADDVRSIYQHVQRLYVQSGILVEEDCPKTQPRTYNVARFVWEEEFRCGTRPSWPVLLERWNERNPDPAARFSSWRAFRTCFKRGEKATQLRYAQGNDYISSEAREHRAVEARQLRLRLQHLSE
jgi:hypothetical protein